MKPARFAQLTGSRLALFLIVAIGFALRIVAALVLPDQSAILGDAIAYREVGQSLWTTGQLGSPYYLSLIHI